MTGLLLGGWMQYGYNPLAPWSRLEKGLKLGEMQSWLGQVDQQVIHKEAIKVERTPLCRTPWQQGKGLDMVWTCPLPPVKNLYHLFIFVLVFWNYSKWHLKVMRMLKTVNYIEKPVDQEKWCLANYFTYYLISWNYCNNTSQEMRQVNNIYTRY